MPIVAAAAAFVTVSRSAHLAVLIVFMADLFFMTPEGAILARPASEVRAGEGVLALIAG